MTGSFKLWILNWGSCVSQLLFLHPLQQIFHSSRCLFVLLLSHHPVLSSHFLTHTQQQTASWLASQWDYKLGEILGMVVSQFSARSSDVLFFSEPEPPASAQEVAKAWSPQVSQWDVLVLFLEVLPPLRPHHQLPHWTTVCHRVTSVKHAGWV